MKFRALTFTNWVVRSGVYGVFQTPPNVSVSTFDLEINRATAGIRLYLADGCPTNAALYLRVGKPIHH
jgi:hypothetical protein